MKALVKSKRSCGLWLEEVPEPEIGINDVKVRVLLTGICGTDLHIYEWDEWAQSTIRVPLVIGHEFVGRSEEHTAGKGPRPRKRPCPSGRHLRHRPSYLRRG